MNRLSVLSSNFELIVSTSAIVIVWRSLCDARAYQYWDDLYLDRNVTQVLYIALWLLFWKRLISALVYLPVFKITVMKCLIWIYTESCFLQKKMAEGHFKNKYKYYESVLYWLFIAMTPVFRYSLFIFTRYKYIK